MLQPFSNVYKTGLQNKLKYKNKPHNIGNQPGIAKQPDLII